VAGLGNSQYELSYYIDIDLRIQGYDDQEYWTKLLIRYTISVIKNLYTNFLINIDIMGTEQINVLILTKELYIKSYNIKALFTVERSAPIVYIIRSKE